MKAIQFVTIGIAAAIPIFSQGTESIKPSFDVAAIKHSSPGTRQSLTIQPGGRLVANGFSLRSLIAIAYHLQPSQLSVAGGWIANDQWSIEAKAEELTAIPAWVPPQIPEVIAVRLQSLLEDRFALKAHHEVRERQVYVLTVGKNGSKLQAVDPPPQQTPGQSLQTATPRPPAVTKGMPPARIVPPPGSTYLGPGELIGSALNMSQLVTLLVRIISGPVVDKTGVTGFFNARLQFAPEGLHSTDATTADSSATDNPSLFTAIQEQLGLKLESTKEKIEVLVIDSVQRPDGN